jgi:hypothetical protein
MGAYGDQILKLKLTQKKRFHEDGFLLLDRIIDDDTVEALREAFDRDNFHQGTGPIYSRYARLDSDEMDENYFPIIWRRDGYRSKGIGV